MNRDKGLSAFTICTRILAVIVLVELLALQITIFVLGEPDWEKVLIASLVVILFATPMIYFWVARPMSVAYKDLLDAMRSLAYQDPLTELPNRRHLEAHLEGALSYMKRSGQLVAVIYLDLDGFKPINDTYGHEFGDRLLIHVADRLRRLTRTEDLVFRIGGDEFVMLIQNLGTDEKKSRDRMQVIADKLLEAVAAPYEIESRTVSVTCSIGVALASSLGNQVSMILHAADTAMYDAKRAGKNRIVFAEDLGVTWSRLAMTHIHEIDSDHQYLETLIVAATQSDTERVPLTQQVMDELVAHFEREEAYAFAHALQMTAEHVDEHRRLTSIVEGLERTLNEQSAPDILATVTDAIRRHIRDYDTGLVPHPELVKTDRGLSV